MTLQIEFWTVVGFLITFMSFVGGMAKWLFSKAEERQAARFASLEQALHQSASEWGSAGKRVHAFQGGFTAELRPPGRLYPGTGGHRGQTGRAL